MKTSQGMARHAFPLPVFFEAKRWRTTESLLVARETSEEPEELLLLSDDLVSSDSSSSFGSESEGGGIVIRKVSSIRMIWLKLGRMPGSSTQHDCTMNTSSWGVSSGRAGRFCCWYKQEKILSTSVDCYREQQCSATETYCKKGHCRYELVRSITDKMERFEGGIDFM